MALPILDGNQSATTLSTILSSGQHIPAHTVVSLGTQAITDMRGAVSGSVVSISNFPATQPVSIASVTIGNTVTIAGTVTANVPNIQVCTQGAFAQTSAIQTALGVINENNTSQVLAVFGGEAVEGEGTSAFVQVRNQISGTVTASVSNFSSIASDGGGNAPPNGIQLGFSAGEEDYRIVDPSNPLPVTASGTVTANSSNGSLTTRFGSVTTANTAFATSAVTNTNRKYLLIQNITTASNVITVGIGFTPTTTQGIQLFAGAGLTFEGSYIPTGAVNLLSSVTASCYTILEA